MLSSAYGVFSRADSVAHKEELLKDPDFDPSYAQIADFTQVTKFELSAEDIQELAQVSVFSPQSRRALVVPSDVSYGLARMFGTLRETEGENELGVFRSVEEALNWVFRKRDGA